MDVLCYTIAPPESLLPGAYRTLLLKLFCKYLVEEINCNIIVGSGLNISCNKQVTICNFPVSTKNQVCNLFCNKQYIKHKFGSIEIIGIRPSIKSEQNTVFYLKQIKIITRK